MEINFRQATYDEFLAFVFDHFPDDQVQGKWYWKECPRVIEDARIIVGYLTRMCGDSAELLTSFTRRQVAEGVYFLFGAGGAEWFGDQLWNVSVPWDERLK